MKKKVSYLFVLLFIFGILSVNSCYTKKNGIVPCPHGFNNGNIENIDAVPTEKV
ncbi:MAG: hypothetical protein L3J35_01560 [Bacteroidales bacterium]|nr:hypothetical protein [Bacteroidales bacterium]